MARDFGKARRLSRRVFFDGSIGEFGVDDVELPGGRRSELAVLHHPGAAAVVPFVTERDVLLLRQFRHAVGGTIWEVPAGKLDPGESPEHCAARELEEETGFVAREIERLGSILTTPGFTDEVIHLFSGHGLSAGTRNLDADELVEVEQVPFERALAMVRAGEIVDAKSVAALMLAKRER